MSHLAHFDVAGERLTADAAGGLYWPAREGLVVSDLHLEKGSSLARRRHRHLPPYDTRDTLRALEALVAAYAPRLVICLGDSFHDVDGPGRMDPQDCALLSAMAAGRDWVWIAGNHDPLPGGCFGGRVEPELALGPLVFRHQAAPRPEPGPGFEVSGHYHPKAAIHVRNSRVAGRCFVVDEARLIMPAFGAYAGGLNVLDPAIRSLLSEAFHVVLIGRDRVVRMPARRLVA